MSCATWEPIIGFSSPGEYKRFTGWISEQVSAGAAEEMPVEQRWAHATTFVESWYRCPDTGEVWRLIEPEPPSTGLFDRVDPDRPHGR